MKGIAILGSTGSIGQSTLDVLARYPERFEVVALTARARWQLLAEQCRRWRPQLAVLADPTHAAELRAALAAAGLRTEVLTGEAGLVVAATLPAAHIVMAAIVGAAGLAPTLAAARAGRRLLLANKEALVMSGRLLLDAVAANGAELLPIDSEHNAIFQCLPPTRPGVVPAGVVRIWLTASGGPFLRRPLDTLATVTPEQACAHPRWVMGRKISVDSATLMNKGLELIEAQLLFGVPAGGIEVVIHPESIVHSLVAYSDGSTLAQMGNPDMRTPIAHALAWPERMESGVESLDMLRLGGLHFEAPDRGRFPCLRLAEVAARSGGTAAAILNAANEVAVAAFLEGRLNFTAIAAVIERVLERQPAAVVSSLADVLAADGEARRRAMELVVGFAGEAA
ncbi:MAG: 1-deoxy-D-xylulose-5-phosphate reductoisomerase [Pseudomonadota bacterium]